MIYSVSLEQRAITVVVSHPVTLKNCVANGFALFQSAFPHLARHKRHFDVIF